MDVSVGVNHSEGLTQTTMGGKEYRCIQGSVEELKKVAQEIVSGQDLGRRLGDVNAPDLIDQVSNSGDLNLNMQRGNKAESGDVVEEVRSLSPSSLLVCSIPDTGTIELGQDYHTSLVNLSNIAERNSSERVTSSLADLGVIQVSLGTDGIVASKRGRGRPRKGSGVSGLVDAKKSLQYCHSQDSLRLRREIDATIKLGGLVGVKSIGRKEDIIRDISRVVAEGKGGL
ncbi:hypothetical protein V6N11_073420 [Hibiscus sabdariffa]|uniref:Rho termination factor N-terminal domain-containing protein n=1 Tax=Hibiscus sabdariffa TaxID=183260 RepID=A0ABR2P4F9_9ROSI